MTSFSAGEIQVNALWKQGQLTIEDIINSRPRHLTAWFRDKPVEQVVGALPLIFNVCAVAQTVFKSDGVGAVYHRIRAHPPGQDISGHG